MPSYKVTFTAKFEGWIDADDEDEALSEVDIPESDSTKYVSNSMEIQSIVSEDDDAVEAGSVEKKSPYALRTNPGDRFVCRAEDLDWRDSDGGWNLTQGLIHPEFPEGSLVLVAVGHLRNLYDDVWDCYIVPAKEAGNLWPSQDLWKEESDRPAAILTDGEVQTAIANSINMLRRAFIELKEKK